MEKEKMSLEDVSYIVIIISAVMIFFGILFGSFVKYTVFVGALGAFVMIIGIIIYLISQFKK